MLSESQLRKAQQRISKELKSNPMWQIMAMQKYWICPYCGEEGAQRNRTSVMVSEIMYHFLHKCSGWANFTGNYLTRRELKRMAIAVQTRHALAHDPQWKNFDAYGNWYCPFCLKSVSTEFLRRREITPEVINQAYEHLVHCRAYKHQKLQPLAEIRKLVDTANTIKHLALQLKRVVAEDAAWGNKDANGMWICPFCNKVQNGVDVSSHLLLTETAPDQIAAHLVKKCSVYLKKTKGHPEQPLLKPPQSREKTRPREKTRASTSPTAASTKPDKLQANPSPSTAEQINPQTPLVPPHRRTTLKAPAGLKQRKSTVSGPKGLQGKLKKRRKSTMLLKKARRQMVDMLPQLPEVPGYEFGYIYKPALKIQGDLLQISELDDGRVAFAISEVSRDKLEAVYLNEKIIYMLKELLKELSSPREILLAMNENFAPEFQSGSFITMFLAFLDPTLNTLTFANAGHHTPLVYNATRSKHVLFLRSNGLVIGTDQQAIFEENLEEMHYELEADDLVILYTTGIIEVKDKDDLQSFGQEQFHSMIERYGKKDIDFFLRMVDLSIKEFTHNQEYEKEHDLTIFALRVKGPNTF